MQRLPLFMPLSPMTLLHPVPIEWTRFPTFSLVNPGLLSNGYSFFAGSDLEHRPLPPPVYKRRRCGSYEPQPRKQLRQESVPCLDDSSSFLTKNALMLLHDLKPSVEYKLVCQTGPSHRPIFTMSVEVNGQVFEGMAQTKKEAKQAAAEKALRSFAELPVPFFEQTNAPMISTPKSDNADESLDLVYQLKPEARFETTANDLLSEFEVTLILDGQRFIGTGEDEKLAKTRAIQLALEKLFGTPSANAVDRCSLHQSHADHIAQCIQEKFQQLTETDVRLQRRKVLAGVVLTRDSKLDSMEIITITTGSRALQVDDPTPNGHALRDCHAEVLARRCLLRYCYDQLNLCLDGKSEQSIFEQRSHTDRFRLRPAIAFHLYISMAPCGDSRLFSRPELIADSGHSLRKSRGVLRRKLDAAEGTLPISCPGEELSSMSCSDKLCRWNFIGVQGALLSMLIDPIYYQTIIIGSLHHRESIERALFRRIERSVKDLPDPYRCQSPSIYGTGNVEVRTTARAPFHALIWNCVVDKCELVDTFTGLTASHTRSTVSKLALFEQWSRLMKRLGTVSLPASYSDAKQLAVDYQEAKMQVHQAFQANGLGQWMMPAGEYDRFDLSFVEVSSDVLVE